MTTRVFSFCAECWSRDIGIMVRVFAKSPGDLGSIPGRVIPKTQKLVLYDSLLNIQHNKVLIKGNVVNPGKGVASSSTPWCSSYRKVTLRVVFVITEIYLIGL